MNSPQQFHLQTTIAQLTAMTNCTHIYVYTWLYMYLYIMINTIYTVRMFGVGQESRWIHLFCVWKAPQFDGQVRLLAPWRRSCHPATSGAALGASQHAGRRDMGDSWGTPGGFTHQNWGFHWISLVKTVNVKVNVKRKQWTGYHGKNSRSVKRADFSQWFCSLCAQHG